jgi:hypothetical protein
VQSSATPHPSFTFANPSHPTGGPSPCGLQLRVAALSLCDLGMMKCLCANASGVREEQFAAATKPHCDMLEPREAMKLSRGQIFILENDFGAVAHGVGNSGIKIPNG